MIVSPHYDWVWKTLRTCEIHLGWNKQTKRLHIYFICENVNFYEPKQHIKIVSKEIWALLNVLTVKLSSCVFEKGTHKMFFIEMRVLGRDSRVCRMWCGQCLEVLGRIFRPFCMRRLSAAFEFAKFLCFGKYIFRENHFSHLWMGGIMCV